MVEGIRGMEARMKVIPMNGLTPVEADGDTNTDEVTEQTRRIADLLGSVTATMPGQGAYNIELADVLTSLGELLNGRNVKNSLAAVAERIAASEGGADELRGDLDELRQQLLGEGDYKGRGLIDQYTSVRTAGSEVSDALAAVQAKLEPWDQYDEDRQGILDALAVLNDGDRPLDRDFGEDVRALMQAIAVSIDKGHPTAVYRGGSDYLPPYLQDMADSMYPAALDPEKARKAAEDLIRFCLGTHGSDPEATAQLLELGRHVKSQSVRDGVSKLMGRMDLDLREVNDEAYAVDLEQLARLVGVDKEDGDAGFISGGVHDDLVSGLNKMANAIRTDQTGDFEDAQSVLNRVINAGPSPDWFLARLTSIRDRLSKALSSGSSHDVPPA
jgi:hypothetical protein